MLFLRVDHILIGMILRAKMRCNQQLFLGLVSIHHILDSCFKAAVPCENLGDGHQRSAMVDI